MELSKPVSKVLDLVISLSQTGLLLKHALLKGVSLGLEPMVLCPQTAEGLTFHPLKPGLHISHCWQLLADLRQSEDLGLLGDDQGFKPLYLFRLHLQLLFHYCLRRRALLLWGVSLCKLVFKLEAPLLEELVLDE